ASKPGASSANAAPAATVAAPDDWVVAKIPQSGESVSESDSDSGPESAASGAAPTPAVAEPEPAAHVDPAPDAAPAPPAPAPESHAPKAPAPRTGPIRGEAVVRDLLGARYIEERPLPSQTESFPGAPRE